MLLAVGQKCLSWVSFHRRLFQYIYTINLSKRVLALYHILNLFLKKLAKFSYYEHFNYQSYDLYRAYFQDDKVSIQNVTTNYESKV